MTFGTFAKALHEYEKPRWTEVHAHDVTNSLGRNVLPTLGTFEVTDIDEPMLTAVLSRSPGRHTALDGAPSPNRVRVRRARMTLGDADEWKLHRTAIRSVRADES